MFIREGLNMTVDPETNEIGSVSSAREAIQRIYVAPEPMHVIYQSGKHKEEADVETNDVIVTFYTDEFDKRMIVVKSEEWIKNLESYEKRMEEARLKAEKSKNSIADTDACPKCYGCETCCPSC